VHVHCVADATIQLDHRPGIVPSSRIGRIGLFRSQGFTLRCRGQPSLVVYGGKGAPSPQVNICLVVERGQVRSFSAGTRRTGAAPTIRKVNPWDLNETDPTDNGTMGTIPGPVIELNVGVGDAMNCTSGIWTCAREQ